MKRLFFCLLFVFFVAAAGAQAYTVTEAQLQKLETIYQSYRANNATLQLQLNESKQQALSLQSKAETLQSKAETLQNESATLKEQLETERASTRSLNESLKRYELNESARNQQILELTQEIAERDQTIGKLRMAALTLTTAVLALLLGIAGKTWMIHKTR